MTVAAKVLDASSSVRVRSVRKKYSQIKCPTAKTTK
jgi:hypothetical protein